MPHHTPLIATIVGGLVLAFIFGTIAHRLKASPLVGYLVAGILVGPFTPGFVADQPLANELAEIGVILLMFGVGLHFSVRDLLSVKAIAVPGAIIQIAVATLLGMAMGWWFDWPIAGGIVFGLALSVASTVVLLRAMQERRLLDTNRGRIAIGWLIVEDLVMVLALVLIPAIAGGADATTPLWQALAVTLAKVVAFVALMFVVGRRFIPWLLHWVAHSGSRELFRLAVLAIALGVAFGAAMLFGVSFALGAFFAGMILSESPLSQRATEETLPLRDAFAVLFFVSVGMLFNPYILVTQTLPVLAVFAIIVVGKSIAAFAIVRAFGHPTSTALTISASLAQIGEFSFILAGMGVAFELFPAGGRDLILAGAILSILANPFLFRLVDWHSGKRTREIDAAAVVAAAAAEPHVILVGYGRVGRLVGEALKAAGRRFTVIDAEDDAGARVQADGGRFVAGNAADGSVLALAKLGEAGQLFVAIPEAFEAGQIVEKARALNPAIEIVARAHSDAEVAHLSGHGADRTIMGEREIAARMIELALARA